MPRQLGLHEKSWSLWCHYCGNEMVATGLAILLCHSALFYLRQTPRLLKQTPFSRLSKLLSGDKQQDPPAVSSDYAHLALGIDLAIEIPLIVAYHPATMFSGTTFGIPFPSIIQVTLQLLVLLLVEGSFHYWIMWFLPSWGAQAESSSETPEQTPEPYNLAMEFMRPRGTLLVAMTFLGVPSMLTWLTGKFHITSVIIWVVLRQSHAICGYGAPRKLAKEI